MIEDNDLKSIVQALKKEFSIQKAFLFGSRARSKSGSDSDYDILIIVDKSSLGKTERMQKAHLALWDAKVYKATDIFVYTQDEFVKGKELFNSIPEIVSQEGKEIPLGAL